jgi:hypothetical protein
MSEPGMFPHTYYPMYLFLAPSYILMHALLAQHFNKFTHHASLILSSRHNWTFSFYNHVLSIHVTVYIHPYTVHILREKPIQCQKAHLI